MLNQESTNILINSVTPQVMGIIWITDAAMSRALPGFDQLNYLFDGLLSQFISNEEMAAKRANIFFTQNFNQTLFLAHLKNSGASPSELSGEIDEQIALIQSNNGTRSRILVLMDKNYDWYQQLSKRYSQFQFTQIVL